MKFTYVFCIRSFFVRERIEFFFRLFPNALKTVTSVRGRGIFGGMNLSRKQLWNKVSVWKKKRKKQRIDALRGQRKINFAIPYAFSIFDQIQKIQFARIATLSLSPFSFHPSIYFCKELTVRVREKKKERKKKKEKKGKKKTSRRVERYFLFLREQLGRTSSTCRRRMRQNTCRILDLFQTVRVHFVLVDGTPILVPAFLTR